MLLQLVQVQVPFSQVHPLPWLPQVLTFAIINTLLMNKVRKVDLLAVRLAGAGHREEFLEDGKCVGLNAE